MSKSLESIIDLLKILTLLNTIDRTNETVTASTDFHYNSERTEERNNHSHLLYESAVVFVDKTGRDNLLIE